MRSARIKVKGQSAVYHCMTRVVAGEMLLDDRAKEVLRKQLRYMAQFCGVEVLTYCIMSNHFHVLVRVPESKHLSDHDLVDRFELLYGKDKGRVQVLRATLRKGGKEAQLQRDRLLARMGDVSLYMKELKQRFSIWYNKSRGRYGTLWAERFKSVLVENSVASLRTVAAYIDLNPVRAGIVDDPKDYRYCGYAEALMGNNEATKGIGSVLENDSAKAALPEYRKILFLMGSTTSQEGRKTMSRESVKAVVEQNGELPLGLVLRLRVRYFTDGLVLGSKEYVDEVFKSHRHLFGRKRKTGARPVLGMKGSGLSVMRNLRKNVYT